MNFIPSGYKFAFMAFLKVMTDRSYYELEPIVERFLNRLANEDMLLYMIYALKEAADYYASKEVKQDE